MSFEKEILEKGEKLQTDLDSLAAQLGWVIIINNRIDHALAEIISNIVNFNDLNFRSILIATLSNRNKIDLLSALLNKVM